MKADLPEPDGDPGPIAEYGLREILEELKRLDAEATANEAADDAKECAAL